MNAIQVLACQDHLSTPSSWGLGRAPSFREGRRRWLRFSDDHGDLPSISQTLYRLCRLWPGLGSFPAHGLDPAGANNTDSFNLVKLLEVVAEERAQLVNEKDKQLADVREVVTK